MFIKILLLLVNYFLLHSLFVRLLFGDAVYIVKCGDVIVKCGGVIVKSENVIAKSVDVIVEFCDVIARCGDTIARYKAWLQSEYV